MAKDLADEDDDKFESMDEESLGFLEQVRKGKSRNFVLSMKGNKVRSMVVKKKPIKEKDRKAARGEGFQPIFGVATGMGAKITFTIARSDGFDERAADRKTEKLKKFLSTQTGKAFKPEFELVAAPPPIPFDDDDSNDPLIARFMKMEPVISKARDLHPASVPLIQTTVDRIRGLLQDDEERASAGPQIDEFVQYLKDLLSSGSGVPPAPPPPIQETATSAQASATISSPPPAPAADTAVLATKLAEALKKLKPLMDKVIDADPNRKGELHATMAQIAREIKAKQFDQAKQNVTDVATLLKSLAAQQQSTPAPAPVDRLREFSQRLTALEPRFLEAQRADRERAAKLGAVWNYANEQAQADNLDNASKALDRLQTAVDDILAKLPSSNESAATDVSIVRLGKARLEWRDIRQNARGEMERLKSAFAVAYSDEPEMKAEVDAALSKLDAVFLKLNEELYEQLDEVLNESNPQRRAELSAIAKKTMSEFMTYVDSDPIMSALDGNEILPDTKITEPIRTKLKEVAAALG